MRANQDRAGKGKTWLLIRSMGFKPVRLRLQSPLSISDSTESVLSMIWIIRKQYQGVSKPSFLTSEENCQFDIISAY